MTIPDASFIIVGKFGATHGVHGWIRVNSFTELSKNILDYTPWYIKRLQQDWAELPIEDSKFLHDTLLVKVKHIDSPEEARLLTGLAIGVTRDQLPKLPTNEYYWSDLIGLRVFTQSGEDLGVVSHLMETGSNDVLVVKNHTEHAIPYLMGTVIQKVDLENQQIIVDWEPL